VADGLAPGVVVLLAGGVGGARIGHGLQAHLGSGLTVIVNTADDLERHGLRISPDHDTVMYTLAGIDNREWGWGIDGETFTVSEALERLGEDTWFRLGDRDLATHIARTARLRAGDRPTEVALDLQRALGVQAAILPMTDSVVRTEILTDDGWLEFQEYFVHRRQEPTVHEVRFRRRRISSRDVGGDDRHRSGRGHRRGRHPLDAQLELALRRADSRPRRCRTG